MPKRFEELGLLLVIGAMVFSGSQLAADTVPVSWVGPAGGSWSTASNWIPAIVPNNNDGTTYSVTVTGSTQSPAVPNVVVNISPSVDGLAVQNNAPVFGYSAVEVLRGSTLTAGTVALATNGNVNPTSLDVDFGAGLNANAVKAGVGGDLDVHGTANIGSMSGVYFGDFGLANVGALNPGPFTGGPGTLNVASPNLLLSGNNRAIMVGGTFTLGTGNLLPLSSQNTLANAGSITVASGVLNYLALGPCPPVNNGFFACSDVFGSSTYDEVIGSPTTFGTLSAPDISLSGTLDVTLANGFTPAIGQRFIIMNCTPSGSNCLSGAFANVEGQPFNDGTESGRSFIAHRR
jgi:hypothetical protein